MNSSYLLAKQSLNEVASSDAAKLLCVLLFYAFGRFIYHPSLYFFLSLFFFLFVRASIRNWKYIRCSFAIVFPLICLFFIASIGCYGVGDSIRGNYYLFMTLIFFCLSASPYIFTQSNPSSLRVVSLVYVALVLPFVFFPILETMGTYQPTFEDIQKVMYKESQAKRLRAFFYHSNEFAIYSAAFFLVQLTSFKQKMKTFSDKFIDISTLLVTLFFIYKTRSATAYVIVFTGFIANWLKGKFFVFCALFAYFALTISQLFYSREVALFLKKGSFFWRFDIADRILLLKKELIDFTPGMMGGLNLESWPHSFILDTVLTYGFLSGFLPLLTLVVMIFNNKSRKNIIWFSIFFSAAAVQPLGAMPVSYLTLVCSVGVVLSTQMYVDD